MINNIDQLDLGSFLQTIFDKGIYHQTSRDYSDWDMIKMHKVAINPGRSFDFQLSTSLAPGSTQRRDPGRPNKKFPKGFTIAHQEYSAKFKEIQSTIELQGSVLERASETVEKYADVWATQAQLSLDGARRVMSAELYQDGTGALGHVSAQATPDGNGDILVQLKDSNRNASDNANYGISYAGWFLLDDIILPLNRDGSTASPLAGAAFLQVPDIDELNGTVKFRGLDANFAEVNITTAPDADEVLYRFDQEIFVDFGASSTNDFGDVSTPIVGFESLCADDGRLVHGMTMSGALKGSRVDALGQSIDVKFIEKALNLGKRRVGPDAKDWKSMRTSYQTRSALIESKEADRRFVAVTDNTRGSAEFNYVHGKSQLRLTTSEFVPEDVIWMLPEEKGTGEKVMCYVGDEMKVAKYGNMADFHYKRDGDGNTLDVVEQYLRGNNLLLCKHPASVISIVNFKNQ